LLSDFRGLSGIFNIQVEHASSLTTCVVEFVFYRILFVSSMSHKSLRRPGGKEGRWEAEKIGRWEKEVSRNNIVSLHDCMDAIGFVISDIVIWNLFVICIL
jgi:hypothetical protein